MTQEATAGVATETKADPVGDLTGKIRKLPTEGSVTMMSDEGGTVTLSYDELRMLALSHDTLRRKLAALCDGLNIDNIDDFIERATAAHFGTTGRCITEIAEAQTVTARVNKEIAQYAVVTLKAIGDTLQEGKTVDLDGFTRAFKHFHDYVEPLMKEGKEAAKKHKATQDELIRVEREIYGEDDPA